ncbi:basic proline-rich protein-like [Canis lupus familiaris]|uniref:basic proline-rich protein-like n=1 Tax=Canis lupus familiaris TaxID=9615 RepID=UPI0018F53569|nr:basic proline-rich protein-like [Canis lupus familiaris]
MATLGRAGGQRGHLESGTERARLTTQPHVPDTDADADTSEPESCGRRAEAPWPAPRCPPSGGPREPACRPVPPVPGPQLRGPQQGACSEVRSFRGGRPQPDSPRGPERPPRPTCCLPPTKEGPTSPGPRSTHRHQERGLRVAPGVGMEPPPPSPHEGPPSRQRAWDFSPRCAEPQSSSSLGPSLQSLSPRGGSSHGGSHVGASEAREQGPSGAGCVWTPFPRADGAGACRGGVPAALTRDSWLLAADGRVGPPSGLTLGRSGPTRPRRPPRGQEEVVEGHFRS